VSTSNWVQTTIANGTSLSPAIDLADYGYRPIAIVMPGTWTAANLTFQASHDGSTFNNLYTMAGVEYLVTATTSQFIILNPADFLGVQVLKIRSGTSGTPVSQGADRVLTLVTKPY
jgi:hypothetical protein